MSDEFLTLAELPEKGLAFLAVNFDSIEMRDWGRFVEASDRLMLKRQKRLVLDLRRLRRVLSVFIGAAVQMSSQAKSSGRRFTVLASGQLAGTLHNILGNDILEIVTDGRSPEELTG
jgi:hypothetical protein